MSEQADTQAAGVGDARRALADLNAVMDRLVETMEEETALARAGRLRAAAELDQRKRDLARQFAAESERVKAARDLIAQAQPGALEALRERHEALQALLQTNMTVLATAHAVSEGIIRGVSGELARRQAPSTYGASGRTNAPPPKASQPLALSRSL
jgi:type VI protein secretion system component VasK